MPTDRQTLLRQVTAAACASIDAKPVRVLGVDDWAWNKGKSFGTILVDLERNVVPDLLPTRSADALVAWLEKHPEVMVVSRDRQGSYAEGARRGAPQAKQVADRFHLTLNLTQAVERELAVQRQFLQLAPSKHCRNGIECSRGRACREPFANTCDGAGKRVADMGQLFSPKCANLVTLGAF